MELEEEEVGVAEEDEEDVPCLAGLEGLDLESDMMIVASGEHSQADGCSRRETLYSRAKAWSLK